MHKPQTNSSLQPAKTKSRVSARRQILPTEHSGGSADPEPPELSLNCATNKLSCCRYLPEVTPSVGTVTSAPHLPAHTAGTQRVPKRTQLEAKCFSPGAACTSSICLSGTGGHTGIKESEMVSVSVLPRVNFHTPHQVILKTQSICQ